MLPTGCWICKSLKLWCSKYFDNHPFTQFDKLNTLLCTRSGQLAKTEGGFPVEYVGLLVLFAVSPCPLSLIKHLEHERRQITASDAGVLMLFFYLSAGPEGTLAVFHRADYELSRLGPLRPRLVLRTGWPSLFDGLSPRAWCTELSMWPSTLDPWTWTWTQLPPELASSGNRHVHHKHRWKQTGYTASCSLWLLLQVEAWRRTHMENS